MFLQCMNCKSLIRGCKVDENTPELSKLRPDFTFNIQFLRPALKSAVSTEVFLQSLFVSVNTDQTVSDLTREATPVTRPPF